MKQKKLDEIKHGAAVCYVILGADHAATYDLISRDVGLDSKTAQKVLADLRKHGYISKDERGFYHIVSKPEEAAARYLAAGE